MDGRRPLPNRAANMEGGSAERVEPLSHVSDGSEEVSELKARRAWGGVSGPSYRRLLTNSHRWTN